MLLARTKEFGPLLGTKRVHCRAVPGGKHLLTADAMDGDVQHTTHFPKHHGLEGQPKYDWQDRGDGVMFGVLVDASDPEVIARAASDAKVAARKAELESQIAAMKALPESDRSADLAKLEAWYTRLYGGAV
jgi:hypothetical protein